jgi:two-component system KDP operon response regulator KdpE
MTALILVVDDEESIRTLITDALILNGHSVHSAATAEEALRLCETLPFDLVLLDLKIPGTMDGLDLLKTIRQRLPQTIVIMLTGYGSLDSAVAALRAGAFDYLTKPVSIAQIIESVNRGLEKRREEIQRQQLMKHLEATLQALRQTALVSAPSVEQRFIHTATLTIDRHKRLVVQGDQPIELTATEFDILDYLVRATDRVVTASELVKVTQGYDMLEQDARPLIRVHIQRLRQKLGDDPGQPRYILNVRGKGYRFIG